MISSCPFSVLEGSQYNPTKLSRATDLSSRTSKSLREGATNVKSST